MSSNASKNVVLICLVGTLADDRAQLVVQLGHRVSPSRLNTVHVPKFVINHSTLAVIGVRSSITMADLIHPAKRLVNQAVHTPNAPISAANLVSCVHHQRAPQRVHTVDVLCRVLRPATGFFAPIAAQSFFHAITNVHLCVVKSVRRRPPARCVLNRSTEASREN